MDCISLGRLVEIMADTTTINIDFYKLQECNFDIAVLLPTRGRGALAERCLFSLIDKAHDNSRIEYRIALDNDDTETIEYFKSTVIPKFEEQDINFEVMSMDPMGYIRLHEYVNLLGQHSDAEWLMFWNDDALMNTTGWDDKIVEHNGKFRVLRMQEQSQHPYAIFPIVPKDWYHLLGHLSDHQMSDAQISQIGYMCNIVENIDVDCTHDRFDLTGNNNDETYNNRPQLEGNPTNPLDLNSRQTTARRYEQCLKIMWYLRKTGDYNDHLYKSLTNKKHNIWQYLEANDPNNLTSRFAVDKKTGKQIKE